ncbi:MAG: hypothetical protein K0S82_55 [Gaiellaceae bacterium]|nr:hypothetical protein [Gaiellaceae bacterium]
MNEYVPEPWAFALIALGAWRLWLLVADDVILEKPVDMLLLRIPARHRDYWRKFLECPRCLGFWLCGLGYAIWLSVLGDWPDTLGESIAAIGVWFALSGVVALLGSIWETLTDVQD